MNLVLYKTLTLTLLFLILCWLFKPFRGIPSFLWHTAGNLIKMCITMVIDILQQLMMFLQEALPLVVHKLFQVVLAVFMTLVRAIGWALEKLIEGCYMLFQNIRK